MNLKMKRRGKPSKVIFIFFILFLFWIVLQFLAPLVLQKGSVNDLSGSVGISDNKNVIEDMPFPFNIVYSCGDTLCHQKAERSFFISGNQMPFCSRCTAIFLGITIGLAFMVFYIIELNEKFVFLLIISIIPIAIDGTAQLFGFWESNNIIRFITGFLVGFTCGIAIGIIIDEFKNFYVKKKQNSI